jgi:hypothetical protein
VVVVGVGALFSVLLKTYFQLRPKTSLTSGPSNKNLSIFIRDKPEKLWILGFSANQEERGCKVSSPTLGVLLAWTSL